MSRGYYKKAGTFRTLFCQNVARKMPGRVDHSPAGFLLTAHLPALQGRRLCLLYLLGLLETLFCQNVARKMPGRRLQPCSTMEAEQKHREGRCSNWCSQKDQLQKYRESEGKMYSATQIATYVVNIDRSTLFLPYKIQRNFFPDTVAVFVYTIPCSI